MTIREINKLKKKFKVGDIVVIPSELAHLTHDSKKSQIAEVVGLYPQFFNVKYSEGYQQSIQYKDANTVNKIVQNIA